VLSVAALAATAPSASADDVWLWACHGPAGEALSQPLGGRASGFGAATNDCGEPTGALQAPANSTWTFDMPSGAPLQAVRILRTVTLGEGDAYPLRADGTTLENNADGAEATYPASGSQVAFAVTCAQECAGATVPAIAFRVSDTSPPQGSVGGFSSPSAKTMTLGVSGRDEGVGLATAAVFVDGQPVDSARYGDAACRDLSDGPGIDLPYGLVAQNDVGDPPHPVACVTRGTVTLSVDTTKLAEGNHRVQVQVTDLAGNTATVLDQTTQVLNHPPVGSPQQTLQIGSGTGPVTTTNAGTPPPSGGVAGASATSCVAPKLSVRLADKPVRLRKNVPVLLSGGRYKFIGKLTCRVGNRRRVAPKHAIIDVLSRIHGKTRDDYGTTTAPKGVVSVILTFTKSRTLIFRFTSAEGHKAEVRIPIIVQKAKPFPRGVGVHAIWLRFVTPFERVRFSALDARHVPKGATVTVTCSGEGCPTAHRRLRPRSKRKRMSVLGALRSSDLRPGAAIDVTITKPGYAGVGKLYCVREGQKVKAVRYRVNGRHPSC
jgi:hypothetical protein